ncbi:MAG TPA: AmmeMemoRadiSam system protein B [bacterium (Candidatus Stahlbacteria)]|nr:AmmeMemoRadiSam system protein B [Candidatus Stahlbacteria bacterium]
MEIRNPVFADHFYPGDPTTLKSMIETFISQAGAVPEDEICGAVAPHAGYQFSGGVAVLSHLAYKDEEFDRIMIIGPSHKSYFWEPRVDNRSHWRTPLGDSEIDQVAVDHLVSSGIVADSGVFDPEHSLEVQLPFIQVISPGTKIVPVIVGDQGFDSCKKLGDAISRLPGKTFVIASSDLYHGYSLDECRRIDNHTIETVLGLDPERFSQELTAERAMACGGGPIVALLQHCRQAGVGSAKMLRYTNSNEVMGVSGGYCVGYVSIVFLR